MKPHAIKLPLLLPFLILLTLFTIVSYYNHRPFLSNSYNFNRKPSPSSSTATFPPPPPPSDPPPPSSPPPPPPPPPPPRYPSIIRLPKGCDVTKGEWIRDPDAPYYTNTTCYAIQEHQNCIKYGRPDSDFLKWRWKPVACELPAFDAIQFLELVRGKSMAFVGDSLSRNHMQSLMCLLSKVAYPRDISNTTDENFKRLVYPTHNFTLSVYWSAFLVRAHQPEPDPDDPTHTSLWHLHLDEPDPAWASQIHQFTHIVLSTGNWFTRPSLFFRNRRLIGCQYCRLPNVTYLNLRYSHRAAFRTALRALTASLDHGSKLFIRTVSPAHFEGGEWNRGGDCKRRRPLRAGEASTEGIDREMYEAQVEEFRAAATTARGRGVEMRLLDTTWAMALRPDGHPSRFGHWPHDNVTLYNDCVHWCLPGPIDMWSQLLFVMLGE